jgi:ERCC4-type nuclease
MCKTERKEQNYYRKFFSELRDRIAQHLPPPFLLEYFKRLTLGDFILIADATDTTNSDGIDNVWATDLIIERKSLNDIVSRSAGESSHVRRGTAAYFTQERRLRHCGLRLPFFLIEGDRTSIERMKGVLISREEDLRGPDVIQTPFDLLTFMTGLLARNYHVTHKIFLLHPLSQAFTLSLLSALCVTVSESVVAKKNESSIW